MIPARLRQRLQRNRSLPTRAFTVPRRLADRSSLAIAIWLGWLSVGLVAFFTSDANRIAAQELAKVEEVARQLDELIQRSDPASPPVSRCDDAAFVRRIYLDFAGRIPSHAETTSFLADAASAKRRALIDKLLARPEYALRMRDLFHVMLMERRGDHPEWLRFLESAFQQNKPWDQIVREILDPDPNQELQRGAAFFHTRRLEKVGQQDTDYPGLTRDIGRMFLGMDLQCAQCHNHLQIAAYQQADFQGLFIVYQNSFIRSDVKFPAIGEKVLAKKLDFNSVFDPTPKTTAPRVPGRAEIEIARFEKDQEWLLPPDPKTSFPGTPRFRPMQQIAQELPRGENQAFVTNIVNRLWFVMFGQGLINPLDQIHADNPASHPEVVKFLNAEMIARKFDLREMLRIIALTDTYQRSSAVAEGHAVSQDSPVAEGRGVPQDIDSVASRRYRRARERRLSAEQLLHSVIVATGSRTLSGTIASLPDPASPATTGNSPGKDVPAKDSPAKDAPDPLEKTRAAFVKAFGNVPQEPEIDFSPSLKSSLFLMNDPLILEFLTSKPGNLLDRLQSMPAPEAVADELYLCVFCRKPSSEEQQTVVDYLQKHADRRSTALTNLAWAMLASTEFCLNH